MSVKDLDDNNFSTFSTEHGVALVDIWAPWCGPCRMVSPIVERLAKKYDGKVGFAKLNSDDAAKTAQQLGVMSIPTLLFYKDGKLVDRIVGAYPEDVIEEHLKKLL